MIEIQEFAKSLHAFEELALRLAMFIVFIVGCACFVWHHIKQFKK
jgi:hypothetical protein